MAHVIGEYKNGNTTVVLYDDGTKHRYYPENVRPYSEFPESIDVNTSYRCDGGCKFCYQNSTKDGEIADLCSYEKWLDSIHPFTEMALNCNDPSEPSFEKFLKMCSERNLIANVTVNQIHFARHFSTIEKWSKDGLVHGVGISVNTPTDRLIEKIKKIKNSVVHTIVGITTPDTYYALADKDIAVLILGYKDIGRGKNFHVVKNQSVVYNTNWLYRNIDRFVERFKVTSFDNLACKQLNVKRFVPNWDSFYMGDDGTHTMYVDLVKRTCSTSSLSSEEEKIPFTTDTSLTEMFGWVRTDNI